MRRVLSRLLVSSAWIGLGLVARTGAAQGTSTSNSQGLYVTHDPSRVTCLLPEEREREPTGRCYVMECGASGDHCSCPIKLPNGWKQPLSVEQCLHLSQILPPLPSAEPSKAAGEEKPRRTGDCTEEQQKPLQDAVNAACKVPRRCNPTQDCTVLRLNYDKNLECAKAREAINRTCFRGGDASHREVVEKARGTAAKCLELMKAGKCI